MLSGSATIWNILESIKSSIAEAAILLDNMLEDQNESSGHEPGSNPVVGMAVNHSSFSSDEHSLESCTYHHVKGKRYEGVQEYIDDFDDKAKANYYKQQHDICDSEIRIFRHGWTDAIKTKLRKKSCCSPTNHGNN